MRTIRARSNWATVVVAADTERGATEAALSAVPGPVQDTPGMTARAATLPR